MFTTYLNFWWFAKKKHQPSAKEQQNLGEINDFEMITSRPKSRYSGSESSLSGSCAIRSNAVMISSLVPGQPPPRKQMLGQLGSCPSILLLTSFNPLPFQCLFACMYACITYTFRNFTDLLSLHVSRCL